MFSFFKKTKGPVALGEHSSVDWAEAGRSRSDSSASFVGLNFSSSQDPEKAGPIRLGNPAPPSWRSKLRRISLYILPKVVVILALYACCAFLLTQFLLPQETNVRSVLYRHAENSTAVYQDLPVTLGVVPKRVASHNDYTRAIPLYTALATGASSVEADVWLVDGEVRIGHHKHLATWGRTLRSLYVEPLMDILTKANAVSSDTINGVFQMAPEVSLQLLIDFKEDSSELYQAVLAELEPLRSANYLTTYNGTINPSAITVVGSGLARLDLILNQTPRDLFFDAKLDQLSTRYLHLDSSISPLASVELAQSGYRSASFWMEGPQSQMTEWVRVAHSRGIATRVWGLPENNWLRRKVWRDLMNIGVDWLNCDNLDEASVF